MMLVASPSDVLVVHETLLELRNNHRIQAHIPLFFYPLGLAMVLILLALSSMSKRQSVSVGGLMVLLNFLPVTSDAGILDFKELHEAKEAYERGEYASSERLFARYQIKHDSPQVRYNRANALYMSGRYERARFWYERVYTNDPILKARTRYNLKESIAQIEAARVGKKSIETGGKRKPSDLSRVPLKKKTLKSETRLFEW
jgi:Ca-activated chloride channel family protein